MIPSGKRNHKTPGGNLPPGVIHPSMLALCALPGLCVLRAFSFPFSLSSRFAYTRFTYICTLG